MALTRRNLFGRAAAGGAGLGIPAVIAACGPGGGGPGTSSGVNVKFGDPVRAVFWHTQSGTNETALNEMVDKFNKTNGKNITLVSEYQGSYTQVFQKIMAAIQAGSPPDTAVAYESMVAEYTKANAVIDLDPYAIRGPLAYTKESLDDIFPAYIESNRYDAFNGKLLSFPFTKSLAVQYYNEDLLRGAGIAKLPLPNSIWSMTEFKEYMAKVSKPGAVYGHNIRIDTSYIDAFVYANQGELLTKDKTKVRFTDPQWIEVFEMWDKMVKDGHAYVAEGRNYQADFGNQRVATYHESSTGRSFVKADNIMDKATGREKFKWGIGMLPQKDTSKPATVMFGGNITVFRTTELKQAASWEWIKFFMDKDQTVDWSIKSSYMPTRKSSAEHPVLKAFWEKEPQAKQAFELTRFAKPEPNITAWQDIRTILEGALTAVTTGKSAPKAALEQAARDANRLIDEKK
jgi:ABC-type glycerol-3-phosphate transport system substrate-binding protein